MMKKFLFLLSLVWLTVALPAQVVDVCAGDGTDSVTLSVNNYQYGNIQWQYSEDTITWMDIPRANDTVYRFKPEYNTTRYYRAWMQYPNCPADYSQITRIQFTPTADAGPDRVLSTGYVVHMLGNKVEDAHCQWQVIEGDSAELEDPYYYQSQFTGSDTLYYLTWTIANACGISTDTVEIRYVETRFYDAIAIVDTTDIILSDSAELASGIYRIIFSDPAPDITDSTVLVGIVGRSFLRKVLWFSMYGDTCEMVTKQATLVDILLEGAINYEAQLFPDSNEQRGSIHQYTRAELLQDWRYTSGRWGEFLKAPVSTAMRSTDETFQQSFDIGMLELTGGWKVHDVSLAFDDTRIICDFERKRTKINCTAGFVGTFNMDFFVTATSGSVSLSKDIKLAALPVPIGPIVIVPTASLQVDITASLEAQSSVDIPFHFEKPIRRIVTYAGTILHLLDGALDYEKELAKASLDVLTQLQSVTFEASLAVGPKVSVYVYDFLGPFIDCKAKIGYKVCNGINGFESESKDFGVVGDFGLEFNFDWINWKPSVSLEETIARNRIPYRITRGPLVNTNLTAQANTFIMDPIQVKVYNQKNQSSGGRKVIFQPVDGTVALSPSGAGSSELASYSDVNGIAQVYWKPGTTQNATLKAIVMDCNGNHIKGSPLHFYANGVSAANNCLNSTLSLDIDNGQLRTSGGAGLCLFSADGISWLPESSMYPLIPGHTYYVKDEDNCQASATWAIQEVEEACSLTFNTQENGLHVMVMVNNGTSPYHYFVDNIDITPSGTNSRRIMQTFATAGVHTFKVEDANGCTFSKSVQVTDLMTAPRVITYERYNEFMSVYDEVMGVVVNDGGTEISSRGIQYSLSLDMSNPIDLPNSFSDDGIGAYICTIPNVVPGTTYYARAYAINSKGPAYGNIITLTVPGSTPGPGSTTSCGVASIRANETGSNGTITAVRDHENNTYAVVQIGSQCWLKENMRCITSPTTSANMVENPAVEANMSATVRRAYYYDNNPANAANGYGLLYNWPAAMDGGMLPGTRGICPEGWHVPTTAEWNTLFNAAVSQHQPSVTPTPAFGSTDGGFEGANTDIAQMLSDNSSDVLNELHNQLDLAYQESLNTDWEMSIDEYNIYLAALNSTLGNATGFSALPAGICQNGEFYERFIMGSFWSSNIRDLEYAEVAVFALSYLMPGVMQNSDYSKKAQSLRCVRNETMETITTSCHTSSVHANETGSDGTITAVRDHENNNYAVVQIGSQCWLKENMRCTTSPTTGANMVEDPAAPGNMSSTERRAYYYENNVANAENGYGLLYNWTAATDGALTDVARGICPEGWHLPTGMEWALLMATAVSTHQPNVEPTPLFGFSTDMSGSNTAIVPMLSDNRATTLTNQYDILFQLLNNGTINEDTAEILLTKFNHPLTNITGFSSLSAGIYNEYGFLGRGLAGGYWVSLFSPSNNATAVAFSWLTDGVEMRSNYEKQIAQSVRCVRNTNIIPAESSTTGTPTSCTVSFVRNNETGGEGAISAVRDHEGNNYDVVQIGSQCWLKENMRCTTSPTTGMNMVEKPADGNNMSDVERRAYYFFNDTTSVSNGHGLLYNWPAAMDGDSVQGSRGICPEGWHLPSNDEWIMLFNSAVNTFQSDSVPTPAFEDSSFATKGVNTAISQMLTNYNDEIILSQKSQYVILGEYLNIVYQNGWSLPSQYSTFSMNQYNTAFDQVFNNPFANSTQFSASAAGGFRSSWYSSGFDNRKAIEYWTSSGMDLWEISQVGVDQYNRTPSNATGVRCVRNANDGTLPIPSNTSCNVSNVLSNEVGSNGTIRAVRDHENNNYAVVQIGSQCWLKENMRCTTSPTTGANMVQNPANGSSSTERRAYYYDNNPANAENGYGLLYNWPAVMDGFTTEGARGICPEGWHVPTDADWTTIMNVSLANDLSGVMPDPAFGSIISLNGYYGLSDFEGSNTFITSMLSDSSNEYLSSLISMFVTAYQAGNISTDAYNDYMSRLMSPLNNATGFSALPTGAYTSSFSGRGQTMCFASSYGMSGLQSYRLWSYLAGGTLRIVDDCAAGTSVRCVRDNSISIPAISDCSLTDVGEHSAVYGADVISDGGAAVTARGICWSTSPNPSLADSHAESGGGTGPFSCSMTNLSAATTYFVRAYATNSAGTYYSLETDVFTTSGFVCGNSVTDPDGNTYNTIQIGTQCWMKENLRTTHFFDGIGLSTGYMSGHDLGNTAPHYYDYTTSGMSLSERGLLYNWKAVSGLITVGTFSFNLPMGICPFGWHVPSDTEWTQLTNYVKSQSQYVCGSSNGIAKALASTSGWNSETGSCIPGDQSAIANNATGLSIVPSGSYVVNGSFVAAGNVARLWTSTEKDIYGIWIRSIGLEDDDVNRESYGNSYGLSVRCIHD